MTLYYEDLEPGSTYECGSVTLTKDEIIEFAQQFDPQPFHTDEEAAKESMFGELVASGLHTLCLSVRLFVTEFIQGGHDLANMGGLGMDDLQWHEPVRPGDTLTLEIEILDKRRSESRDDRGYVEFERRMVDEDGVTVLSLRSHNIVERQ
ncbi:MaoC family dehydratase [Salinadaptatus halalkaliphilus]|uniref:MaoC family dehydratase n=1 Tax=Salinadaptatus halalkaliphilus TaxID=2419781 RepID=A0A4S3TPT8_9EURY|nr:MaoC family dehydratase [Salinadaptatus halalkaliphilus]THE66236.1 MaoC family dehydratase [Salinadaptatus halalkaliphilus]